MNARALGEHGLGDAGPFNRVADAGLGLFDGCANHDGIKNTYLCDLQAPFHINMSKRAARPSRMDRTPDQRRDIFQRFMRDNGLAVATWAKRAGISANSVYNFLAGRSDGLSQQDHKSLHPESPLFQAVTGVTKIFHTIMCF